MELAWLRDVVTRKKTISEASPSVRKTLADFDVDALSSSTEHHTEHVMFRTTLVNSPRSAVVVLRNGVRLYDVLRRPPGYYAKATETVDRGTLNNRFKAAEEERLGVLAELRRQYGLVCASVSFDDVGRILAAKAESRAEEAQIIARERLAKEQQQFQRMEDRDRHIADMRRKAALDIALSARAKSLRSQKCRDAAVEAVYHRAEALHQKVVEKKRVASKILEVREMLVVEEELARNEKRAVKTKRIADIRAQRQESMLERAAETEDRINRAREAIAKQEMEHAALTRALLEKKKKRAEEFLARKAQEYADLQHRSDDRKQNQMEVLERSRQAGEDLRDRIEDKMRRAEARFEQLQADRLENIRCAKILHHEKTEKLQLALEAAARYREELATAVRENSERADQLLAKRLEENEKERMRIAEVNNFSMNQKIRILVAKQQQSQFQRLLSLSRLARQEEERAEVQAMEDELSRLAGDSKKAMIIRRHHAKEAFAKRNIEAEKATFLDTMRLEGAAK
jgi:hypothetical protein